MVGWFIIALRLATGLAFASEGAEGAAHGAEAAAAAHGAEAAGGEHGGHGGIPTETLIFTAINLIIFLGLMVKFAGRPVGDALKNRALTVRAGLDEASKLQSDAQARFADVESKLVALGRQVEQMKDDAKAEAQHEAEVLTQRADADAARLQEAAERTIREETTRATNAIRGEAAAMAVELAREMLRREVNVEDQQRLARQFLAAVKKEANHG